MVTPCILGDGAEDLEEIGVVVCLGECVLEWRTVKNIFLIFDRDYIVP